MELRPIRAGHPDAALLDRLNNEAFPDNERLDTGILFSETDGGGAEVLGIYEDDMFAGFFFLRTYKSFAYLGFFAICPELRSKGVGSRALRKLKEHYAGRAVVVEFEAPGEGRPENETRLRRRAFYLRCGYHETGVFMAYCGDEFEVVCSEPYFDRAGFEELVAFIHRLAPSFDPVIYEKK